MIDIHCHLLPGIDDGPPTMEIALELARALVADGVKRVVCTPHVFPGRFENRRSNIEDAFTVTAQAMAAQGIALELAFAGEVRLTPEVLALLPGRELPFLGASDGYQSMLLEMPDGQVPLGAEKFVRTLMRSGIRPVIAHPERNRGVMEKPQRVEALLEEGCLLQLTAGSLVGQFGERAQATAQWLIDQGWVHAVASDAHNLSGRRPRMKDAAQWLRQHFGEAAASTLTVTGPMAICGLVAWHGFHATPLATSQDWAS